MTNIGETYIVYGHSTNTFTCTTCDPPVASCQDITVYVDNAENAYATAAAINNGTTSDCGLYTLTLSQTSFTCLDTPFVSVTLTAIDSFNQTGTCNATVTILDTLGACICDIPVAACQDATVYLDGSNNASLNAAAIDAGSAFECGQLSLSLNQTSFTCADLPTTVVSLIAEDINNDTDICTATVTVMDTIAPTAICLPAIQIQLTGGTASVTGADFNAGSTDNCALDSFSVTPKDFTCANVGNNTVTVTAYDVAGNTATCQSIVLSLIHI